MYGLMSAFDSGAVAAAALRPAKRYPSAASPGRSPPDKASQQPRRTTMQNRSRLARGVAEGAPGPARRREGILAPAGGADAPPHGNALGARGKILPVRRAERRPVAHRSLRRPLAADRLPLHAWSRLAGRRASHCSFWADNFNGIPVHLNHRDVTFTAVSRAPLTQIEAYRKRHGLELPMGVILRQRLQLRLSGIPDARNSSPRARRTTTTRSEPSDQCSEQDGHQRILQGRQERAVPHLFLLLSAASRC